LESLTISKSSGGCTEAYFAGPTAASKGLIMKNWILKLLLLAAVIVGVGAYRGWFTVNETKFLQDEDAAKSELHDLGRQVKEKASDLSGTVKADK
jgi:hypothetical protein